MSQYRRFEDIGTYIAEVGTAVHDAVTSIQYKQSCLAPDDQLDELGEAIFRLAIEAGADIVAAESIAMDGNLRQRTLVRDDLLNRIIRTRRQPAVMPDDVTITAARWPIEEQLAYWTERDITSYVYAIQAGDNGPVKIGHSINLRQRLATLQTGSHETLNLRAIIPGGPKGEAELHRQFADSRLQGEWFGGAYLPVVLDYIHGLATNVITNDNPDAAQDDQRDTLALRREIERLWLEGHTETDIARWVNITTDDLADHIAVMRRSTLYDIKRARGNTTTKPTRHESMTSRRTA